MSKWLKETAAGLCQALFIAFVLVTAVSCGVRYLGWLWEVLGIFQ